MREENFWCKKPRYTYSEVRVITRRVIARYDCIVHADNDPNVTTLLLDLFRNKTNFVPAIQDNKLQFMGSIDGSWHG